MKRKVLLVSKSSDTGGAAIASFRLFEALKAKNADVNMLVQDEREDKEGIYLTTNGPVKRWMNLWRFIVERLVFLRQERSKNIRFLFSLANTGESIIRNRYVKEAGLIHLHWINGGFLSLRSLKQLLKSGKPVVWTFHDMWPFTGGCHYALDCKGYTRECGQCPYLKKPSKKDLSHRLWKKKERLFRNSQVTVITPSSWLNERVQTSSLLHNWKVVTIHNPIDHGIFKPVDRETACHNLELDPSKLYILFGAATITNMLKGFNYFLEAIQDLARTPDEFRDVEILLFGKTREDIAALLPLKTRNMAFVQTTRTLVELYSAAHLFVIPSLQDNLPNTILESMFCGTPVVGFRTGGIPEMIDHQVNGYLADFKSSSDLAEGIRWVLNAESYNKLSQKTRDVAIKRYSQDRSVQMHIDLYNSLMDKANQS